MADLEKRMGTKPENISPYHNTEFRERILQVGLRILTFLRIEEDLNI